MSLSFSYACFRIGFSPLSAPINSPRSLAQLYISIDYDVPNIAKYYLAAQISQLTLLHATMNFLLSLLLLLLYSLFHVPIHKKLATYLFM